MFSSHWNCDILYQFSKVWRLSNCVFFHQTYVEGPNQRIECSSVLEAEDRAFKLMFLPQLNYPEECKNLWELIQFKFSHIKLHMVTPVVDEFLRQLKDDDDNISEMAWWVYNSIWWLEMWYLQKANFGWIKQFHRWKYQSSCKRLPPLSGAHLSPNDVLFSMI